MSQNATKSWHQYEFEAQDLGEHLDLMQFDTQGLTRGINNSMDIPWDVAESLGKWLTARAEERRAEGEPN